jgi:DNA-directed RNA polymerase beta' subunit
MNKTKTDSNKVIKDISTNGFSAGFRQSADFTYHNKIETLSFYVMGTEENMKDSNVVITNKELFKSDLPIPEGVYDAHMGTTDHMWLCETCGNTKAICPGHPGSIDLHYPVKSPLFREFILKWLKVICFKCGSLLSDKVIKSSKSKLLSEYVKISRTITVCSKKGCGEQHPTVSKDKFEQAIFYAEYSDGKFGKKEELYNHEIKQILNRISDETVRFLGKPLRSHPKNFILNTIRAAPNTIRPDIRRVGGNRSNNSVITALIKNIIEINDILPTEIPEKDKIDKDLREMYFNLDMTYYEMIKGTSGTGNQVRMITNTNKTPNSIANRIPKKEGRIRRNLMGKRVRYMMRSVITGDNMLKVDEVGVPLSIAKSIQIPETVRPYNRDRLNTYYMNKNKTYPGCSGIIKVGSNKTHKIDYLDISYQLQDGDIIMRDMITGDVIGFNRQPSLLFSGMSAVKVIVLNKGETLRMNVSSCNLYNADFDGDQMNGLAASNIQSRNELSKLSSVGNWMISYKDSSPAIGAFQDSLIGMAEFTRSDIYLDKYHAMKMFSQVNPYQKDFNFSKKQYQSRELISMFIPKINYPKKKSKLYMPQYTPFIKYNPKDIEVQINRGELVSGILDKSTIGQGTMGSIFHIINNEYGYDVALDTVYSFQQIATAFFFNYGFTIGITDINISEDAVKRVKLKTADMINESRNITKKLNKHKLIAPIGMTLLDFYEAEQLNALEPGDDFVEPILADINFSSNKMAKLVFTGSKGKETNVIAINGAIGTQQINGKRMIRQFGWGRTSPYFLRYDTEPKSLGYISNSFREGVSSDIFPFVAAETRHGLINNALSTSITGHQNRLSIKNLESIVVDNLYKSVKEQSMIQPLYAESGLDPRKTEKVKFLTVMISDTEMESTYKTKLTDLDKIYRNKNIQSVIDNEYKQLLIDRALYRKIFFRVENSNPGSILLDNKHQMPVNVFRIIEDVVYNYNETINQLPKSRRILDPIKTVNKVSELCRVLPYVYFNEIQETNKMKIPEYILTATTLVCILIRSYLCTAILLKRGITDDLLDIIITKIRITFKMALIDYGCAVGIIAAQCISEPMTQYVLDSKHRTGGGGGSKTNTIVRIKEILGAKDTEKMKNPSMFLLVLPQYEDIKLKVQEIANHIEMMDFNRFVSATRIFFESYGNPKHSKFKHETKMIAEFEKYNLGIDIPNDITKWCIRFNINKEEMILNSMKLETIITELRNKFTNIFFVYTPENVEDIIIRCYIRNSIAKNSVSITEPFIIDVMKNIRNTVIRGVSGIKSTDVVKVVRSNVEDDGSISTKVTYGISTMGSNMEEILNNPFLDIYRCQTDSIVEFESIFGIEAVRHKISNELRKEMPDISKEHCSIYADEMTYSGHVTSIHRTGLQKREMNNVTLRLSFQSPIQVIENAATDGLIDKISGISGPLILGTSPNIGTTYNKIILSENFINEYNTQLSKDIDNEL